MTRVVSALSFKLTQLRPPLSPIKLLSQPSFRRPLRGLRHTPSVSLDHLQGTCWVVRRPIWAAEPRGLRTAKQYTSHRRLRDLRSISGMKLRRLWTGTCEDGGAFCRARPLRGI